VGSAGRKELNFFTRHATDGKTDGSDQAIWSTNGFIYPVVVYTGIPNG
jgi:hypothetical protein